MLQPHPEGTSISVWVVPGSNRTEIGGVHGDALEIRVSAPAEAGRANHAPAELLSDVLGAPCRLGSGPTSRRKSVVVVGRGPMEVGRDLGVVTTLTTAPEGGV